MSNLYKYKDLKLGIIVLCPNINIGHLRNTINSIDTHYPNLETIIILPENCSEDNMKIVSKFRKSFKGGKTVSSMINCGLSHAPCNDWNMLIFSKGWLKNRIDIKYSYFVEAETDILFPITNHKTTNFIEENISMLMVHKKSFKKIGEFPNIDNLEISKLIWATKAIEKKCTFKGIVGGKCF